MRTRITIGIAVAALAAAAVTAGATGGARVVGNCRHSQVRPAEIVLACADANALLTKLRWRSFGGPTALASGNYTFNDCIPYCAAGKFHSYPVSLVFSAARRCPDGFRDYRLAVGTYTSKTRRPRGAAGGPGKPGRFALYCPLPG